MSSLMPQGATPPPARARLERRRAPVKARARAQLSDLLRLVREAASALEATVATIESGAGASAALDIRGGIDFYEAVERFEIDLIERALRETDGHQKRAARLLGLKYTTLHAKLKHYKIRLPAPAPRGGR